DVVINEIAASGDPHDWIELLNRGDEAVDLTGWTLTDDDPVHRFQFADGASIGAGQYLLILGAVDQGGFDFGIGKADAVFLYAGEETVSFVSWEDGQSPKGWSYGRIPDGTGDFESLAYPTPGAPNGANPSTDCGNDTAEHDEVCDGDDLAGATCEDFGLATGTPTCNGDCAGYSLEDCDPPSRVIVINEARATGDDKIELMNPGDDAVDLTSWWMTDEKDAPTGGAYEFPDGTVMAAGEYLVLEKGLDHVFGL
ncbi:MAG: lamin tail domain-containing protein, partial [Actinomycetia bacterium]|nr:lamin tail domain-containing protein [Actinomycetes bacterium]